MKRLFLPIVFLAAGPALGETLPQPPIPPERPPVDEAAPIPARELRSDAQGTVQHASVTLKVFRSATDDSGLGFTPGSRFRSPEERKPMQTPGISFTVPIQ